jgi:ketosteroid isomerase-like protein
MRAALALLSAVVLLLVFPPIAAASGSEAEANQAEINKNVVRRAFRALEQGDLKTLNEVYDPKRPIHTPQGKTVLQGGGPYTELKESCGRCAALNPRKITIDLILAEGDLVTVRSTWTGKYSGTYRGTPVTGKDIEVIYTNVYRIVGGRIVENWVGADRLALAEQLGMTLAPATTPN